MYTFCRFCAKLEILSESPYFSDSQADIISERQEEATKKAHGKKYALCQPKPRLETLIVTESGYSFFFRKDFQKKIFCLP